MALENDSYQSVPHHFVVKIQSYATLIDRAVLQDLWLDVGPIIHTIITCVQMFCLCVLNKRNLSWLSIADDRQSLL